MNTLPTRLTPGRQLVDAAYVRLAVELGLLDHNIRKNLKVDALMPKLALQVHTTSIHAKTPSRFTSTVPASCPPRTTLPLDTDPTRPIPHPYQARNVLGISSVFVSMVPKQEEIAKKYVRWRRRRRTPQSKPTIAYRHTPVSTADLRP